MDEYLLDEMSNNLQKIIKATVKQMIADEEIYFDQEEQCIVFTDDF